MSGLGFCDGHVGMLLLMFFGMHRCFPFPDHHVLYVSMELHHAMGTG
jgi:hypothetical protein